MAKIMRKLGDDISTDIIYPGRFMATVLPTETPQFAFADDADLNGRLKKRRSRRAASCWAARTGCGSSREQAASSPGGHGPSSSPATSPGSSSRTGSTSACRQDLPRHRGQRGGRAGDHGAFGEELANGKTYNRPLLPKACQAIVDAGGLIPYARKKLVEEKGKKCRFRPLFRYSNGAAPSGRLFLIYIHHKGTKGTKCVDG